MALNIPQYQDFLTSLGIGEATDSGTRYSQGPDGESQRYSAGMLADLQGDPLQAYQSQQIRSQGYVPLQNQQTINWFNQNYGTKFKDNIDYMNWLYGSGGGVEMGPDNQQYFRTPNGADSYINKPLSYNPPDPGMTKLVKGGLLAFAGAGLGGMLPGAEGIFGAGSTGVNAGGLDGILGDAGSSWGSIFGAGGGEATAATLASGVNAGGLDGVLGDKMSSIFSGGSSGGDILSKLQSMLTTPMTKTSDPFSTAMNLASGIYGLKSANDMKQLGREGMERMDPFGSQRPQYQQQLAALMADPSLLTKMPGYNAGLQAVERKMASQGYLGSGNMMTALADYGGNFFNQEANRLAMLGGANIGPSGGNLALNGANNSFDAASKALASMGFGIKQIAQILGQQNTGA